MEKNEGNKKILIIGIVVIIVIIAIWFWPKKTEKPNTNIGEPTNNYLYTWTSDKYVYTDPETNESKEYYFDNYKFDFYKDEMNICYVKNNECESHKYSITDNRILNIEGESEISNFTGQFFLDFKDNYVLFSRNNENGENSIFKFNITGGTK